MTQLGKYQLHEELGRGGYGTVYRAYDTVLKVERAVKVLHPALVADPEFIERFKREAQLAAQLDHPNIVPVYDLGEDQGRFFLVMKYISGGSLKNVLVKGGKLPFQRAAEIIQQIGSAINFAHEQDLIHRDIKPGNILFDSQENAYITDLGFAKALSGSSSSSLSVTGGMIGTPPYMAPEVWRKGEMLSTASDVYSLACVFFEMVTGKVLFDADSPPEIMTLHILEDPQFPSEWPSGMPLDIEKVLLKGLEKDQHNRYNGANTFCDAIAQLTDKSPEKKQYDLSSAVSSENAVFKVVDDLVEDVSHQLEKPKNNISPLLEKPDEKKAPTIEDISSNSSELISTIRKVAMPAIAVFLVIAGVWLLAVQLIPGLQWFWSIFTWPVLIILVGIFLLLITVFSKSSIASIVASIVTGFGCIVYWQNATGNWESWVFMWTLLLGFGGFGKVVISIINKDGKKILSGIHLIIISLIAYMICGAFFGFNAFGVYWPLMILLAGIWIIISSFFRRKLST